MVKAVVTVLFVTKPESPQMFVARVLMLNLFSAALVCTVNKYSPTNKLPYDSQTSGARLWGPLLLSPHWGQTVGVRCGP